MAHKIHTGKTINLFLVDLETELELPYIDTGISAGFPSPALDFIDLSIDLNKLLIKHPSASFFGRVKGHSLINAGIDHNDLMIIDRSLEPVHGKIAVCFLDGEFTAKRIKKEKDRVLLTPENEDYKPIVITAENNLIIWGIVTYVIKEM